MESLLSSSKVISMKASELLFEKVQIKVGRHEHPNTVQYFTVILLPILETPIRTAGACVTCLIREVESQLSGCKPKIPFADAVKITLGVTEGLQ